MRLASKPIVVVLLTVFCVYIWFCKSYARVPPVLRCNWSPTEAYRRLTVQTTITMAGRETGKSSAIERAFGCSLKGPLHERCSKMSSWYLHVIRTNFYPPARTKPRLRKNTKRNPNINRPLAEKTEWGLQRTHFYCELMSVFCTLGRCTVAASYPAFAYAFPVNFQSTPGQLDPLYFITTDTEHNIAGT